MPNKESRLREYAENVRKCFPSERPNIDELQELVKSGKEDGLVAELQFLLDHIEKAFPLPDVTKM